MAAYDWVRDGNAESATVVKRSVWFGPWVPVEEDHMAWGRNAYGEGPSPYEPHAHPFGIQIQPGLVACCTGRDDCRIEGHITRTDDGYRHIAAGPGMDRSR